MFHVNNHLIDIEVFDNIFLQTEQQTQPSTQSKLWNGSLKGYQRLSNTGTIGKETSSAEGNAGLR